MTSDRIAELKALVPDNLVAQVAAAAAADPAFLDAFLKDPKGAYRGRFGAELLPGHDVTIERRPDGAISVYLPQLGTGFVLAAARSGEAGLSDAELELAAGGTSATTIRFAQKGELSPPGASQIRR